MSARRKIREIETKRLEYFIFNTPVRVAILSCGHEVVPAPASALRDNFLTCYVCPLSKRVDAIQILASVGASQYQDFHTLSSSQVDKLVKLATIRRYRKPAGANGSLARCFFALIQRRARQPEGK